MKQHAKRISRLVQSQTWPWHYSMTKKPTAITVSALYVKRPPSTFHLPHLQHFTLLLKTSSKRSVGKYSPSCENEDSVLTATTSVRSAGPTVMEVRGHLHTLVIYTRGKHPLHIYDRSL